MIPVLSVVGQSNSGKTSLIERLIPQFKDKGLKVGVVKHTSKEFINTIDMVGKDTYRHRQAGADTIMILSSKQMMVTKNTSLELLENNMNYFEGLDLIITEGFKKGIWPKIEVFRSNIHEQPYCINDSSLLAVVSDVKLEYKITQFKIDDISGIVNFIIQQIL